MVSEKHPAHISRSDRLPMKTRLMQQNHWHACGGEEVLDGEIVDAGTNTSDLEEAGGRHEDGVDIQSALTGCGLFTQLLFQFNQGLRSLQNGHGLFGIAVSN